MFSALSLLQVLVGTISVTTTSLPQTSSLPTVATTTTCYDGKVLVASNFTNDTTIFVNFTNYGRYFLTFNFSKLNTNCDDSDPVLDTDNLTYVQVTNLHPSRPYNLSYSWINYCNLEESDLWLEISTTGDSNDLSNNITGWVSDLAPYNDTNMELSYSFTWTCLSCNGNSQFVLSAVETSDCSAPSVFNKSAEYNTCITEDQRMTLVVYLRYGRRYNVTLQSCRSDNDCEILNTSSINTTTGPPLIIPASQVNITETSFEIDVIYTWMPEDYNGDIVVNVTISNETDFQLAIPQHLTCPNDAGTMQLFNFSNLHAFRNYTISSQFCNETHCVDNAIEQIIQTYETVPAGISNITSYSKEASITLQWVLPLDDCNGPTYYQIAYSEDLEKNIFNQSFTHTTSELQTCNFTGSYNVTVHFLFLHSYRNYSFNITPVTIGNFGGEGPEYVYESQTLQGPAPRYNGTASLANYTQFTVTLQWIFDASDCNGITYFNISFTDLDNDIVISSTTKDYNCDPSESTYNQTYPFGYPDQDELTVIYSDQKGLAFGYADQNELVLETSPFLIAGRTYNVTIQACTSVGCGEPGPASQLSTPALPPQSMYNNYTLVQAHCNNIDDYQIAFEFDQSFFDDSFGAKITNYSIVFAQAENISSSPEELFSFATSWKNSTISDYTQPFFVTDPGFNWNPFNGTDDAAVQCCTMDSSTACNCQSSSSIYLVIGSTNCSNDDEYCVGQLPTNTNFTVVIQANVGQCYDGYICDYAGSSYIISLAISEPYVEVEKKNNINGGMIAGIVIGAILLLILIFIILFFAYKKFAKKSDKTDLITPSMEPEYRHLGNDLGKNILVTDFQRQLDIYKDNSYFELIDEYTYLNEEVVNAVSQKDAEFYTKLAAILPKNIRKNRFADVLPFDRTRVVLDDSENDYINASFIEGANRSKEYIAAQGPMDLEDVKLRRKEQTVEHFWKMIWQQNITCIVMLTQCQEKGRTKCARYWPEWMKGSVTYGDLEISNFLEIIYPTYIWRKFHIKQEFNSKTVIQYQFLNFPDMEGTNEQELLEFLDIVRTSGNMSDSPTLVHCSAGVGRSGTFIALDILIQDLKYKNYVNIFECVRKLRQQRVLMVQVEQQYILLYKCIGRVIQGNQRRSHQNSDFAALSVKNKKTDLELTGDEYSIETYF